MKSIIWTLTFVLLLAAFASFAQTAPHQVVFDFDKKEFTGLDGLDRLKPGEYVQVTVKNINLHLYQISVIKKSDTAFQVNLPATLLLGQLPIDELKGLTSALTNVTVGSQAVSRVDMATISDIIVRSLADPKAIPDGAKFDDSFESFTKATSDIDLTEAQELFEAYSKHKAFLEPSTKKGLWALVANAALTQIQEIMAAHRDKIEIHNDLKKELDAEVDSFQLISFADSNMHEAFDSLIMAIANVQTTNNAAFKVYRSKKEPFEKSIKNDKELKKSDEAITKLYTELAESFVSMQKAASLALLKKELARLQSTQEAIPITLDSLNSKQNAYLSNLLWAEVDSVLNTDLKDDFVPNTSYNAKSVLDSFFTIRTQAETNRQALIAAKSDYDQAKKLISFKHLEDKNIKKAIQDLDKAYHQIDSLITSIKDLVSADAIYQLAKRFIQVRANTKATYTSMPIRMNGDQMDLSINITPKDSSSYLPSFNTGSMTFPAYSNTFWGVSTGFYLSSNSNQYFSSINTDSVHINAVTNDTTELYQIVEETGSEHEVGIHLMVRGGIRIPNPYIKGLYLQAGLGPGITIDHEDNIQPRVLFGGGIAIGKHNKFFLDIGGIYQWHNVLSNAFSTNPDTYYQAPQPNTFTVTRGALKFYGAIGYTIKL